MASDHRQVTMIGYQQVMTRTVAVSELKTHCLSLVEKVARERRELIEYAPHNGHADIIVDGAVGD